MPTVKSMRFVSFLMFLNYWQNTAATLAVISRDAYSNLWIVNEGGKELEIVSYAEV